jgi:hypothetical protein
MSSFRVTSNGPTRTFYRPAARRYAYGVLIFGLTWAFCGVYAGLLAPVVWSGTNAFVAEPVGVLVTGSAVWVLVVGVRFCRLALIVGPSVVRVRGPVHDHVLAWNQIRRFEQGRVSGWTIAGSRNPVVVVQPVEGRPIVVHALRVDHGTNADDRAVREVQELCDQLEALRPAARAEATPSLSAS